MQIAKSLRLPAFQHKLAPDTLMVFQQTAAPPRMARLKYRLRWFFDIDEGAGALTILALAIAVLGTLFVRLAQLAGL